MGRPWPRANHHRRQGGRRSAARRGRRGRGRARARAGRHAGPRRGAAWARTRRARSMCAPRRKASERRHGLGRAQAAGRHPRGRAAGADRRAQRRPDVHGILVQLPLPKHIDAGKVIEAIAPAKDVDGFHPVNVGRLATGGQGARAVHARRLPDPGQVGRAQARGAGGGRHRPLQHRRQADGAAAARRELHGDDRPLATHDLPGGRAPRRHRGRRRRPAGDGEGRLDQARRHRHRRGHQPGHRAATARHAWSATWRSPRPRRSPAPSRRCPAASAR